MGKKEYNKEYYKKHIDSHKEYYRIYHETQRMIVFDYYCAGEVKCMCCGEIIVDFLTLDHINNDGNKHRKGDKSAKNLYQWIIKHNFPKGFQVMCMNCNMSKGKRGICIHNT